MSINTLTSNPALLENLRVALALDSSGGLMVLNSPDNNLLCSVSGDVGYISLANDIDVVNDISLGGKLALAGNVGTTGQVLTSGGSGNPSWTTLSGTTGLLKHIDFVAGPNSALSGSATGTLYDLSLTGLTPGKTLLIAFSGTYVVTNSTTMTLTFTADSVNTTDFTNYYIGGTDTNTSATLQVPSNPAGASSQTLSISYLVNTVGTLTTTSNQWYSITVMEIQ